MKKYNGVIQAPFDEDGAVVEINNQQYEVSDEEYSVLHELRQKTDFNFKEIFYFDWVNDKISIYRL